MTTEPRQEAEQIVHRVVTQAITTGSNAHVVDDTRLVDALAAAIEVSEANPEPRSAPLHRLNEALSALREDTDG